MEAINLQELNAQIKLSIQQSFVWPLWITCEISDMSVNKSSGHCYLELIEKSPLSETILAKARATIWRNSFEILTFKFKQITGETLRPGLKVMVSVTVDFQEVYGLSLNIRDINPTFTLGDLAQQRLKIIEKLKKEGIFEMNRELELPLVAQKIAIISSKQAAGYEDFMHQLNNNTFGIKFYTKLFQASMQGADTEESITNALYRIMDYEEYFDLAVIIRGGGSKTDLAWFDNYAIASAVAQFPLPILSGIGHDRDQSIVDMVAHTSLKTPTAVAEFLIERAELVYHKINNSFAQLQTLTQNNILGKKQLLLQAMHRFTPKVNSVLEREKLMQKNRSETLKSTLNKFTLIKNAQLLAIGKNFQIHTLSKLRQKEMELKTLTNMVSKQIDNSFNKQQTKIKLAERTLALTDPINLLKRGYSITYFNGKAIKDPSLLSEGSEITTQLEKGILKSTVKK